MNDITHLLVAGYSAARTTRAALLASDDATRVPADEE